MGKVTPDIMQRALSAFGVGGKPAARTLAWLMDKTVSGDYLDSVEFAWLESWLIDRGLAECRSAICVQITLSQLADDLFSGHKTTARRAVSFLVESEVLTLIHKGYRGHGSLYLLGLDRYTKTAQNVYETNSALVHKNWELVHKNEELVHKEAPLNRENDVTFITNSNNYSYKGEEESAKEISACPQCGSTRLVSGFVPGSFECRDCDVHIPPSKAKAGD